MKPLYVKKNGTVNKVSGVAMPNTFPANRVGYDNTASELEATNTQDAIDEVVDIVADKVDKVSSATNGNLAGLDASGNLTDAGWSADKTITSATGNPISISGLKSNQLAIGPIITLEPIQAGSGDPSPNNIRAISGYDKIEVLSCRKNLCDEQWRQGDFDSYSTLTSSRVSIQEDSRILLKAGVTYYFYNGQSDNVMWSAALLYNKYDTTYFATIHWGDSAIRTYTPDIDCYIAIVFAKSITTDDISVSEITKFMVSAIEITSASDYEPYKSSTDLTIQLGQTIYGGTLDVEKGILTVDRKCIDLGDLEYYYDSSNKQYYSLSSIDDAKIPSQSMITEGMICSKYVVDARHYEELSTVHIRGIYYVDRKIYIAADSNTYTFTGVQFVYPLATPYTIQLTPHEISLLKDYAYVSTNGTNMSFSYKNGEIASLGDVSQVGETLNELGDIVSTENSAIDAIVNAYGSKNLLKTTLSVGTIDQGDIRITVNEDGSLYIIGITDHQRWPGYADGFTVPYSGYYILSGNPGGGAYTLVIKDLTSSVDIGTDYGSGVKVYIDSTHNYQVYWYLPANIDISSGLTFKPMLRDARISDPTFAPYAMTNVELTRVSRKYLGYVVNGTSKQFTIPNAERGGVYIISIHNSYAAGVVGLLMLADELGSSIYIDLKSSEYFSITIDGVGIFTITAGQAAGGVYCTSI